GRLAVFRNHRGDVDRDPAGPPAGVDRPAARPDDCGNRDPRRPGGVTNQARPGYQGHGAHPARARWADGPVGWDAAVGGGHLDRPYPVALRSAADEATVGLRTTTPPAATSSSGRPRRGWARGGRHRAGPSAVSRQTAGASVLRPADRRF